MRKMVIGNKKINNEHISKISSYEELLEVAKSYVPWQLQHLPQVLDNQAYYIVITMRNNGISPLPPIDALYIRGLINCVYDWDDIKRSLPVNEVLNAKRGY